MSGTRIFAYFIAIDDPIDEEKLTEFRRLLSAEELAKMARFVRAENRLEYLVAHALLRLALSRFAPVPPQAWEFSRQSHGRPFVSGPALGLPLSFSLSHTEGMVACVVAHGQHVGVDVEKVNRSTDGLAIAETSFSPAEVAWLRSSEPQQQQERFIRLWTLKEAYAKARGLGLSLPLDTCSFCISPSDQVTMSTLTDASGSQTRWQFAQCCPRTSHVLSVAVDTGNESTTKIQIEPFNA